MNKASAFKELGQILDYALELKVTIPKTEREPPVIGIAFANIELPQRCSQLASEELQGITFDVNITFGKYTALLLVREAVSMITVFKVTVNITHGDLIAFKENVTEVQHPIIIFGGKRFGEYYISPPESGNAVPHLRVGTFKLEESEALA